MFFSNVLKFKILLNMFAFAQLTQLLHKFCACYTYTYIMCFISPSVCDILFVPEGQIILTHRGGGGANISHTQEWGGTNIFTSRGDKHFLLEAMVAMMM